MGLFSLFKKAPAKVSTNNSFVCDFIDGPKGTYKSVSLAFLGDGSFRVNSDIFKANFPYVKDIGMSSDMKYARIEAGGWWFYTTKSEKEKLMQCLNDARTISVEQSTGTVLNKNFEQDYLAPGMAILEVPRTFNVQGVSYNYQADTRKKISQMYFGSTLNLKFWPDAPDEEHKVCVFDDYLCQIGYFPLDKGDPLDAELYKQLVYGIPFTATMMEKGIVQDTDIWWCKADFTLKVPYPADSEMVFVNGFGGAYHCRSGCCRADWAVPMYLVSKFGMTPCKRCHKAPKE